MARRLLVIALTVAALGVAAVPATAADYTGPLIDAHSHVPNATAIDAYVAAMKRHNVRKVVLLGVCLLYTSPSPRDRQKSRMPSSA